MLQAKFSRNARDSTGKVSQESLSATSYMTVDDLLEGDARSEGGRSCADCARTRYFTPHSLGAGAAAGSASGAIEQDERRSATVLREPRGIVGLPLCGSAPP
eukprot:128985-Prymnesium_polylepis.1